MPPGPPPHADTEARAGLPAGLEASPADVLSLFLRLLPAQFFTQLREKEQLRRQNNRVYSDSVVLWLMIVQRVIANGTLETAVMELLRGLPTDFWPRRCKRLQVRPEGAKTNLSGNTASYNQARQHLPLAIVEQSADQVFRQLLEQVGRPGPVAERQAFFVDGSSLRMPYNEALSARYPPGSNQNGKSHWPLLRIVVAHDLYSGLAMRPEWGALNGNEAVSEQSLLEQAIGRLPTGCIVLGDANFGVFSVAYAGTQRGHPVVLRLTLARARHLAEGELREEMDFRIRWQPSRDDRRNHPELPADASVTGRLIVRRVQPDNGAAPFLLALFTTLLEDEPDSILKLYGYRWNIGVSSQGHIFQPVRDRPRLKDSGLVAWEASWRESKTAEPSDNMLGKEYAQHTRLQRTVNADVASLHESPVAETVYNARKQQGLAETSPIRQLSPAGYQRRHGVKDDVETGEALGARRRNLVEEMPAITASGKCWHRHQGDGSGRSVR
jgi:hypothetical protein